MENIIEFHLKYKINLNFKNKIYYYVALSDLNFIPDIKKSKDIFRKLFNLFFNFNYLSSLSENNTQNFNILLFLYNNNKEINIICDKNDQKTLTINPKLFNNNENIITKCFYLSKLITSDFIMVWYTYEFSLIDNLMKILYDIKKQKKYYYKQVFLGKLIYDIIDGYQNSEIYNENNKGQIENYYKEIKICMVEGVKYMKFVCNCVEDVDELLESSVDDMYCNFFDQYLNLFKNFCEKNNIIEDILNEIELINIHLTEILINKIIDIFDIQKNKDLTEYLIKDVKDLFNKKNIDFLFYIMKYFIKNYSIYVTTIDFLESSKNNILKIVNNRAKLFSYFNNNKNIINNKVIDNIEFVIKQLINDTYLRKFKESISMKNLEELLIILDYYQYIKFQQKANEINTIKNIIKNNEFNNIDKTKYFKDLEKAKLYENKGIIVYYYCKIIEKNKGNKKELTEKEIETLSMTWNKIASNINNNKFKFKRDVSKAIYELFTLEELKKIVDSEEIKKIQQKLGILFKKETIDSYINHYKKAF